MTRENAKKPKFTKAEVYEKYYANSARVVQTPWDISLLFGQSDTHSIPMGATGGITISEGVEIVMSYQHALSFFNLLKGHIDKITTERKKTEDTTH